ncbi:50S rRNA methyltransferase [Achromatium sp. WMS2]|nr:50S rRNA methyltransferase [Achromatium sp. WMS2]
MHIYLLSVGTKMPNWVQVGYAEYARRFGNGCSLRLVEIPLGRRGKDQDVARAVAQEGEHILRALPDCDFWLVALDVTGRDFSTMEFAGEINRHLASGRDLVIMIGGPDGLSTVCQQRAHDRWSLSRMTFPHSLVRVVLAEQLYRAWSVVQGHPYHRE